MPHRLLAIVLLFVSAASAAARELPADIVKLRALAVHGDVQAQYSLGRRYEIGDGITPSRAQAINWYLKAGQHGNRSAQSRLCYLYAQPLHLFDIKDTRAKDGSITGILPAEGTKENVAEALTWCRIGASVQDAHSSYPSWVLGILYARGGAGLKPDFEESYFWLQMAPRDEFFKAVKRKLTADRRRAVESRERDWREANPSSVTVERH